MDKENSRTVRVLHFTLNGPKAKPEEGFYGMMRNGATVKEGFPQFAERVRQYLNSTPALRAGFDNFQPALVVADARKKQ